MKVRLQPTFWRTWRQRLLRWSGRPWTELLLRTLAAMAVSFFLAGVRAGGGALPLSVSMAAALGLGVPSFGAYLGGCLGYVAFWGLETALEPMAAGLLVEAALCILGDQLPGESRWFVPGIVMLFTAAVGILFLIQANFAGHRLLRYILQIAVGGAGTMCIRTALEPTGQKARLVLLAALCGGLCAVAPLGFPLGLIAGCAVAAAAAATPVGLLTAVLCGLLLELCWNGGCTAVLVLAALGSGRSCRTSVRLCLWSGLLTVGVLLLDTPLLLLAAALPGALLSLALPAERLFGRPTHSTAAPDPRLALASGLLKQMGGILSVTRSNQSDPETNAVFDQAAERVCRLCSQWELCWGTEIANTCEALDRAAPAMMTRGKVLREDLPAAFVQRCRHLEGFLNAINRELEDLSCRRQYRRRLRESRTIMAQQYALLADALSQRRPAPPPGLRYQPELGFRSQSRQPQTLSGDRGVSFRVGQWFYLLLCDGMGTGQAASAEAGAAIEIVRTLLQSGVGPAEALCFLNGTYILRDDGGFATVDLLQADLLTGQAQLFKWGAAPSYLKRRDAVEKIGTASPPPGLGAGEEHRPEHTKLSLARGEMLVLLTDGAGGETAERFIRQYGGISPRELASGVVSCTGIQGEDDRTAVVLALRPRLSI